MIQIAFKYLFIYNMKFKSYYPNNKRLKVNFSIGNNLYHIIIIYMMK